MRDAIAHATLSAYLFLLPIAWILLAVVVIVLAPLTMSRRTRGWAGLMLVISSYIIGLTTWTLSAALTFSYFGWFWLAFGLLFLGIGVFPMALWAAFFDTGLPSLGVALLVMLGITWGARAFGYGALSRAQASA